MTCLLQGLKKVKAQGFGANTDEEMDQYGKDDMRALSLMLGNKVENLIRPDLDR
jgi:hypothetical protein